MVELSAHHTYGNVRGCISSGRLHSETPTYRKQLGSLFKCAAIRRNKVWVVRNLARGVTGQFNGVGF